MIEQQRRVILNLWAQWPDAGKYPPATESQIEAFKEEHGHIPEDFRWFLLHCGGGVVGAEWVDNVDALDRTHETFNAESETPNGWTMRDVFVIGWDGAGNPFGIHRKTGQVLVEDHTFGGICELAPSFYAFLYEGLSGGA